MINPDDVPEAIENARTYWDQKLYTKTHHELYGILLAVLDVMDLDQEHKGRIDAIHGLVRYMNHYPDMRIGQIVANMARKSKGKDDAYYLPDEELYELCLLSLIFEEEGV